MRAAGAGAAPCENVAAAFAQLHVPQGGGRRRPRGPVAQWPQTVAAQPPCPRPRSQPPPKNAPGLRPRQATEKRAAEEAALAARLAHEARAEFEEEAAARRGAKEALKAFLLK